MAVMRVTSLADALVSAGAVTEERHPDNARDVEHRNLWDRAGMWMSRKTREEIGILVSELTRNKSEAAGKRVLKEYGVPPAFSPYVVMAIGGAFLSALDPKVLQEIKSMVKYDHYKWAVETVVGKWYVQWTRNAKGER